MPEGNPLFAEVWEMVDGTGRSVRGVVSEVTQTVLTLVSFTGNRFRIAPERMIGSWRFVQPPPPTALRCNRSGCNQAGTMRFQRGTSPEWVCPRHLPTGTQASLTTESLGMPETPQAPQAPTSQCPSCSLNIDPIEDARISTAEVQFWQCPACNTRWGALSTERPLNMYTTINQAVMRFALRAREYRIEITQIEVHPSLYQLLTPHLDLSPTPEGALTLHLAINQYPRFEGLPVVRTEAHVTEAVPMIFRIRGTPATLPVRPRQTPPTGTTEAANMTVNQAMAIALRAELEGRRTPGAPGVSTEYSAWGPYTPGEPSAHVAEIVYQIAGSPVNVSRTMPGRFGTEEEVQWVTEQAPTPFVTVGQRWVMRQSGDLIEVTRVNPTEDGRSTAVHFQRVSDGIESSNAMLQEDFVRECTPFVVNTSQPIEPPKVQLFKGEEWEHLESTAVVTIDYVDSKRDLVVIVQKDGKRRSVPLLEFAEARWRRIIRKTAWEKLLEGDDD